MESPSESSSDEMVVSPESQDAADVAMASISRYYTNMFKALSEREKRYVESGHFKAIWVRSLVVRSLCTQRLQKTYYVWLDFPWQLVFPFASFLTFNFLVTLPPYVLTLTRRERYQMKMEQLGLNEVEREKRMRQLDKIETQYIRARRVKLSTSTFKTIKIIGRGSFGEVSYFL